MYDLAAYEKRCAEVNVAGYRVMIATICPIHLVPMMPTGWETCGCECEEAGRTAEEIVGITWQQPIGLRMRE